MEYIKQNFVSFICLFLLSIILLQRCADTPKPVDNKPAITIVTDTSWKSHQGSVTNVYPTITQTIPYKITSKDTQYIADTNYTKLKAQFEALRDAFLAENIYKDTARLDSSSVIITDTIFKNRISGSKYLFNLKTPVITNTITIKEPYIPVSQVYIGGTVNGSPLSFINSIDAGILYKTKKDRIFELKTGLNINGQVTYGVGTFWKIHL